MKYLFLAFFIISEALAGSLENQKIYQKSSQWYGFDPKKDPTQFILCRINSNNAHNPEKASEKVFFKEGSDQLEEAEKEKIQDFFKELPTILNTLSLSAHADQCGDPEKNLELSQRRAESVKTYLDELISIEVKVPTEVLGEAHSNTHSPHDRFVEITTSSSGKILSPKIESIYLIDGSGSLQSNRSVSGLTFHQIKNLNFKEKTLVFVVREARLGCRGENLNNYFPEGRTFIKEAQGLIATHAKENLNIVTLTDGEEKFSKSERAMIYKIIEDQKEKGTFINWFHY
jgi:outer membrane protein OmpA-like peptidoglycan-associated protein